MGLTELPGKPTEEESKASYVTMGTTEQILSEILFELKKMNVHLMKITDETVTEGDL